MAVSRVLTHQPFKGLWTILILATALPRIFLILVYYLPPFTRQHPKWTWHQAAGKAIISLYWDYCTTVEYKPTKSLKPGYEGSRFVVIEPASPDLYRGILTMDNKIKPAAIGAVWYPRPFDAAKDTDGKFVIHFHGGAFVLGGCRPMENGWGPKQLAKQLDGLVLQVQYRLASDGVSRFPAALQDAVTAYKYLWDQGVPSANIVLSGESAGGNLAIGLLRYLEEQKDQSILPLPRAVLTWSPWVDLSVYPRKLDVHPNARTDYLKSKLTTWAQRAYIPPTLKPTDPYLSPLGNPFSTTVRVFLHAGTAEILFTSIIAFAREMEGLGSSIMTISSEGATHDIFGAGIVVGSTMQAVHAMAIAVGYAFGE